MLKEGCGNFFCVRAVKNDRNSGKYVYKKLNEALNRNPDLKSLRVRKEQDSGIEN